MLVRGCSIRETAAELGFTDQSHLHRLSDGSSASRPASTFAERPFLDLHASLLA
jgi:AraC-like DNA-binding protein